MSTTEHIKGRLMGARHAAHEATCTEPSCGVGPFLTTTPGPADVFVVTEIRPDGYREETADVARVDLIALLQFFVEEGSTWSVVDGTGAPRVFVLE